MTEQQNILGTTNIAAALMQHAVPIDRPQLHPENPRMGEVEEIKRSLRRFGQVRPIMLQEGTLFTVAGNHTLKAARELGWSQIAAIPIEIDDDEALAYVLADNRLGQLGGYDDAALVQLLERLMLAGKLEGTGYTPDQVDDMLSAMDAMPEVEPAPTEATPGATTEQLEERYKNRSLDGPLRQFVFVYSQEVGKEVEGMLTRLARAWGVSGARDVMLEALRRANRNPPVEHLSAEEAERADAPPDDAPTPEQPTPEPEVPMQPEPSAAPVSSLGSMEQPPPPSPAFAPPPVPGPEDDVQLTEPAPGEPE